MSADYALQKSLSLHVLECVNCGVSFGIPADLERGLLASKRTFYCPNGHGQSYTESEADQLRRELETAKRDAEWQKSRALSLDKQLIAQRGVTTKLKKRIGAGVCPCCKRTFKQLAVHMAGQHPDYTAETKR